MCAVEWVRLMSTWQRVVDGSNVEVEGTLSSLALRKPYKATRNAAHNYSLVVGGER